MAKNHGRNLVADAVRDAQSLKEAVVESAKNELIETLTPGLKRLLEQQLKGVGVEGVNRMRRVNDDYPGESKTNFEEAHDKGEAPMDDMKKEPELDLESLVGMFPQLAEMGDEEQLADPAMEAAPHLGDEELPESGIPTLGEAEDKEEEGEMDEEVEISEAELRKVYEAALQTEVQVKKGFGEMTKSGELDEVDPAGGIADVKSGESGWEKVEPPAAQDQTVKEMIRRGYAENKQLRKNLGEAIKMVKALAGKLHETNLFNAKVLHVNRILNGQRLTTEQKRVVMESIDKARSISEVKVVYETIVGSFKATGALVESKARKPAANAQRARSSGQPKQEVLRESVDRGSKDQFARMKMLAGLVK
jgi:hypothetical protein